ncbi:MAG: hypothetical protein PHH85_14045 [Candidatus Methanoperedens sp.]|nr:hypothetical protein [Candidatus Methanoperedens sp.]
MVTVKQKQLIFKGAMVVFLLMIVSMAGCLQEKPVSEQDQVSTSPKITETMLPKTTMDKVSNELKMLKSKGWSTLATDLGRPRTTTLLWYHLKKLIGFEPKVVFGNANKLNAAIGIPIKMGGDSSVPKIKIKGVDYYIIDPMIPEIVSEFDYGYVYDDPGSVMQGFFNNFRLNTDDVALVEMWMSETGVTLSYTDFPVN